LYPTRFDGVWGDAPDRGHPTSGKEKHFRWKRSNGQVKHQLDAHREQEIENVAGAA
jgi:hypothetical protein